MGIPDVAHRWAASGAMALTGDPEGPVFVPPDRVADRIVALGEPFGVDALALLGERAAIAGLSRRGSTSCGGAARLLPAADGWVAVNLARADDVALIPAWLEIDEPPGDPWDAVADELAGRPAAHAVERGRLLGLPVAGCGERPAGDPVVATMVGAAPPRAVADTVVVDLSSLWAGPLCAHLLGGLGAQVIKVESSTRPDGARRGPPAFFDLLHAGQRSVALDLQTPDGVDALRALLRAADVVIEGSRPRALEQLGVDAVGVVREGPQVWVSITGHGRDGAGREAVAFGDDAAVAGGLVAWGDGGRPRFVADAVADPLTGLVAAGAVVDALARGGRWLLDISLAGVAAHVAGGAAGEAWRAGPVADAVAPRARRPAGTAPALGADTDAVLREVRGR